MSILFDVYLGGDPQACAPSRAVTRARPFQSKLHRAGAGKMDPVDLAAVRRAVAEGFATDQTTAAVIRALRRRVSEV